MRGGGGGGGAGMGEMEGHLIHHPEFNNSLV